MDAPDLRELGQQFRVDSIRCAAAAKSGHPTSGMSAADLMAVLVANHLRYDFDDPKNPPTTGWSSRRATRRRCCTRSSARPVRSPTRSFCSTGRSAASLEGHPTPLIPWVDVATGSLGQGLPIGVGMAPRRQVPRPAAVPGLGAVRRQRDGGGLDVGGVRARRRTTSSTTSPRSSTSTGSASAARRWSAGTSTSTPSGRRRSAGTRSRSTATTSRRSTPRTRRPIHVPASRPWSSRRRSRARASRPSRTRRVGTARHWTIRTRRSRSSAACATCSSMSRSRRRRKRPRVPRAGALELPRYELGDEVATRKAYGDALAALGAARGDVVALDGEVVATRLRGDLRQRASGPLLRDVHRRAAADRRRGRSAGARLEAVRIDLRGVPLAARTTSSGWPRSAARTSGSPARTRACRSARTGRRRWRSRTSRRCARSTASTVLLPVRREPDREARRGDGRPGGHRLPAHAAAATPVIYGADEEFEIGGSRVLRSSDDDDVTLVGRRHDRARGTEGGRHARGGGDQRPRDRPLLDQANRRRDLAGSGRGHAAGSSRSRITARGRVGEAVLAALARATRTRVSFNSPSARCRTPASPPSCWAPTESTPRRSPPRRASSFRLK